MVAAFSVNGLALSQILTHQAAYVTDKGFSDSVAAGVVTIFAGMSALANLVWGLLADKFPIRSLVILSFLISSVGVAFLLMADNIYMLALYLLIYGATRGVASLTGLAYANYWGRAFIGSIRGFVTPLNVAASAAGPLLAALIFDLRGSYIVAFSVSLGLFLVAAALMVLAVPPKKSDSAI
jgi:MFS family permease